MWLDRFHFPSLPVVGVTVSNESRMECTPVIYHRNRNRTELHYKVSFGAETELRLVCSVH